MNFEKPLGSIRKLSYPTGIEQEISKLMEANKSITAVTVTSGQGQVLFQTSNWDITGDIVPTLNSWRQQSPSVTVQGIKYSVLQTTPERLVGTNVMGLGHIVAANHQDSQIMIAYVTPEGGAGVAYMDVARTNDAILGLGGGVPAPTEAPVEQYQPVEQVPVTPAPPTPTQEPITMETTGPVPSSTWATTATDTDMKNLLWELEEFTKYVTRGDFEQFLQNLLTEGDQVKIWELIKTLRSLKNFIDRTAVSY